MFGVKKTPVRHAVVVCGDGQGTKMATISDIKEMMSKYPHVYGHYMHRTSDPKAMLGKSDALLREMNDHLCHSH